MMKKLLLIFALLSLLYFNCDDTATNDEIIIEPPYCEVTYCYCCEDLPKFDGVVGDSFFIPNAITPNNDGINDVFVIQGKSNTKFTISSVEIYNLKEEEIVFQGSNLNLNEILWNGFQDTIPQIGTMEYNISFTHPTLSEELNVRGELCVIDCNTLDAPSATDSTCIFPIQFDEHNGYDATIDNLEECF